MKIFYSLLLSLVASSTFAEASVTAVTIKQNWPWSSKVYIDCTLTGVEEKVDLAFKAYNGTKEIAIPENSLVGPKYCLTSNGTYRLEMDPYLAFGKNTKWLDNFKIDIDVVSSSSASSDVIYKIFDFETKTVTDVTRGALLNGEFGAFETDYSRIGKGFKSPLSDVIIWTGVTNYPGAKTTKLVMRRIPAGSAMFPSNMKWGNTALTINVTEPFYIGVFELTQKQYSYFGTHIKDDGYYKNVGQVPANVGDDKPMQNFGMLKVIYKDTRVFDASRGSMKNLKDYFIEAGSYNFHLPTQGMWYRAAMAESTTYYYDGIDDVPDDFDYNERMAQLGRFAGNGGMTYHDDGSISTNGTVSVGQYKPNAFGLYDVLGNVYEATHDKGVKWESMWDNRINATTDNPCAVLGNAYSTNSKTWPQSWYNNNLHSGTKFPYVGTRLAFFEDVNPYVTETTEE